MYPHGNIIKPLRYLAEFLARATHDPIIEVMGIMGNAKVAYKNMSDIMPCGAPTAAADMVLATSTAKVIKNNSTHSTVLIITGVAFFLFVFSVSIMLFF